MSEGSLKNNLMSYVHSASLSRGTYLELLHTVFQQLTFFCSKDTQRYKKQNQKQTNQKSCYQPTN